MKKFNCGIYGFGFVGKAITQGLSLTHNLKIYDIKEKVDSFEDTVDNSEFIFICLPTPMTDVEGGRIDLSIIDGEIDKIATHLNYKSNKIIIIKSTIIPGTTSRYQDKYPELNFIFNPEFLTERNARVDFINTARIVLGGKGKDDPNLRRVEEMYRARFLHTPIFKTNYETAEFVKYLCNNFFANKVMYFNEQRLVAEKFNEHCDLISESGGKIHWQEAVRMLLADGRIGNSHYEVPGHDGQLGFGGSCVPKDLCAYRNWAKDVGAETPILDEDWEYNKKIREDWDWGKMERAVRR